MRPEWPCRRGRRSAWLAAAASMVAVVVAATAGQSRDRAAPLASFEKAQIALRTGNAAQAAALLEILESKYPDDARVWRTLGSAQQKLQHAAQAVVAYQHALALEPDSPQVFYGLGVAHASL